MKLNIFAPSTYFLAPPLALRVDIRTPFGTITFDFFFIFSLRKTVITSGCRRSEPTKTTIGEGAGISL